MTILFLITVFCFLVLVGAAVQIARHVARKPARRRTASSLPPQARSL